MAYAKVTRQWADDSCIVVEVGCDESFPDAIDECVAAAARLDMLAAPDVELEDEG